VYAYDNYEETYSCVDGVVEYEGKSDYYLIKTAKGYTIAEQFRGRFLSVGDSVRGPLNSFGFKYIIQKNTDREMRIYIEDYMLKKCRAFEWLRSHDKLK
jgi:hypothetical protein